MLNPEGSETMYVTSYRDDEIVRTTTYIRKALEINELVLKIRWELSRGGSSPLLSTIKVGS